MMPARFVAIGVLVGAAALGCSGDDASDDAGDAGADAGTGPGSGEGRAGASGSSSGASGSAGRGPRAGTGSNADEDGGAETTGDAGETPEDGGATGSPDGGGPDAGGEPEPEPATGCDGLMACCAELPAPDRTTCEVIATNADDPMCDQLTALFCPPAGGGEDGACATLNECCETLPRGPLRLACASTVTTGMQLQCDQVLPAFCPAGGDVPSGCQMLADCCDALPAAQQQLCDTIVLAGQPANCSTAEVLFCP
jgi:hypothetical protein